MKLSNVNNSAPADVRFFWQDEEVIVSYYPGRITPAWNKQLTDQVPLVDALPQILAHWNVEDDDGQPAVPSRSLPRAASVAAWRELLAQTNVGFHQAIFNAIVDDFTQAPPAETP